MFGYLKKNKKKSQVYKIWHKVYNSVYFILDRTSMFRRWRHIFCDSNV